MLLKLYQKILIYFLQSFLQIEQRSAFMCRWCPFYFSSITEPWTDPELPTPPELINHLNSNKSDKNTKNLKKTHLSCVDVVTTLLINPDELRTKLVIATIFNLQTKHWFPQHYFVMSCLQCGLSSCRSGIYPISCYLIHVWKASLYNIQAGFCRVFVWICCQKNCFLGNDLEKILNLHAHTLRVILLGIISTCLKLICSQLTSGNLPGNPICPFTACAYCQGSSL